MKILHSFLGKTCQTADPDHFDERIHPCPVLDSSQRFFFPFFFQVLLQKWTISFDKARLLAAYPEAMIEPDLSIYDGPIFFWVLKNAISQEPLSYKEWGLNLLEFLEGIHSRSVVSNVFYFHPYLGKMNPF